MYKDKDKQKEANRERQRRYKAKQKALLDKGVTGKALPDGNISIETLAMVDAGCGDKLSHGLKRGKDIKCFEDLPPDVQQTIDRMSTTNGKLDKDEKAKRTAAAIKYQHLFPDSYESAGDLDFTRLLAHAGPSHVRVSKPGDADYMPMCETSRKFIERGAGCQST